MDTGYNKKLYAFLIRAKYYLTVIHTVEVDTVMRKNNKNI